jgi:hypothetical protein
VGNHPWTEGSRNETKAGRMNKVGKISREERASRSAAKPPSDQLVGYRMEREERKKAFVASPLTYR